MALKQAHTYARGGKSKSVASSRCLLDEDTDQEYVPPTTRGSPTVPRTTRRQSQQVVSTSDEATHPPPSEEGATQVGETQFDSESQSGSNPSGNIAFSFEADSSSDTLTPTEPASKANEPNRWCIKDQY